MIELAAYNACPSLLCACGEIHRDVAMWALQGALPRWFRNVDGWRWVPGTLLLLTAVDVNAVRDRS